MKWESTPPKECGYYWISHPKGWYEIVEVCSSVVHSDGEWGEVFEVLRMGVSTNLLDRNSVKWCGPIEAPEFGDE